MAIPAIANSGPQPPTLASLLQINRINPIAGRDSDDADSASSVALPKVGAKQAVTPKLVQDVIKTLGQMGANPSDSKADGAQTKDIKKSAIDFLSSVISAVNPQANESGNKTVSPLEQLKAGVAKMMNEVASGSPVDAAVTTNANQLLKASGLSSNTNTLSSLLEGVQKSLMDDTGSGSLVNLTA